MKKIFIITVLIMLAGVCTTSIIYKDKLKVVYYIISNNFELVKPNIYDSVKMEIEIPINQRIWLHAVNNSQKLDSALQKYSGIECDVFFDTVNVFFDVRHWPEEKYSDLDLLEYFNKVKESKHTPFIWIDFKNLKFLSDSKLNESILVLDEIINKSQIDKNRLIIESENPIALAKFKKNNFHCSYWIPHLKPNLLSEKDVLIWASEVKKNLLENNLRLISMDITMFPYASQYLPNIQKMIWGSTTNTIVLLVDETI